jgi:hypothetical protein
MGFLAHAQSDVWACFEEASAFGREFYTLGGSRGPSLAYYVPSLSACQLLLPHWPERAHAQPGQLYRLSPAAAAQVPPKRHTPLLGGLAVEEAPPSACHAAACRILLLLFAAMTALRLRLQDRMQLSKANAVLCMLACC